MSTKAPKGTNKAVEVVGHKNGAVKTTRSKKTYPVVCLYWDEDEYEPGWGRSMRPDSYTLHLSREDCEAFAADREKRDREHKPSPGGYSFHVVRGSSPFVLDVDAATYKKLQDAKKKGKRGLLMDKKRPPNAPRSV